MSALLAVVALAVCHRPLLRHVVLPAALRALSGELGLEVTGTDLVIEWPDRVVVRGVTGAGDQPLSGVRGFSLRRAEVTVAWGALFSGRSDWLRAVRVEGVAVEIDLDADPVVPGFVTGGADDSPGAPPSDLSASDLPDVDAEDVELVVLWGGERFHLHDVGLELRGLAGRARVGGWDRSAGLAAVDAFAAPLEAEFVLGGSGGTIESEVGVPRVGFAGETWVEALVVRFGEGGEIVVTGAVPPLGVSRATVSVGEESVTVDVELEHAELGVLAEFAARTGAVEIAARVGGQLAGQLSGSLSVEVPIAEPIRWSVAGALALRDASWPAADVEAEEIRVTLRRTSDLGEPKPGRDTDELPLRVEVGVTALAVEGADPLDLEGSLERRADTDGAVIDRCELRVRPAGAGGSRSPELVGTARFDEGTLELAAQVDGRWELPLALPPRRVPEYAPEAGEIEMSASFSGRLDDLASCEAQLTAAASGLRVPGESTDLDAVLEASLDSSAVRVDRAIVRRGDDEVRLAGGARVDPLRRVDVEEWVGSVGGVSFRSRGGATFTFDPTAADGEPALRLEPVELTVLDSRVVLSGDLRTHGGGRMQLTVDDLALGPLLAAVLPELRPGGRLSLTASVSLPGEGTGDNPRFDLDARVVGGFVQLEDETVAGLEVELSARASPGGIDLERLRVTRADDEVEVTGWIPLDLSRLPLAVRDIELDLELRGRAEALIAELVRLPLVESARGRLDLTGRIRGRVRRPDLEVRCALREGELQLGRGYPGVSQVRLDARYAAGRLTVTNLAARVRHSSFDIVGFAIASAELGWSPARGALEIVGMDAEFVAERALLLRTRDLRLRGDVRLALKAGRRGVDLTGAVSINRAYCFYDVDLTPGSGVGLPLRLFSLTDPPFDRMRLDVSIDAEDTIVLRNNVATTTASSALKLTGTGRDPFLSGRVWADAGRVRLGNTQLRIIGAFLEFSEKDPLNPAVQIHLEQRFGRYTVTVDVAGTGTEPEVLLDSVPPLARDELLVLISTGYTSGQIEERGVGTVASVHAAKLIGRRLSELFSTADPTEESIFDRLAVETETSSQEVFEDLIRVEYRVLDGLFLPGDELFLQGERGPYGDVNFGVGLRIEWAF